MLFDRNDWKKSGQLGAVKLFPKLESNGLGSGLKLLGAAVLMLEVADDVPEDASTLVLAGLGVLAGRFVVVSCLA